MGFIIHRQKKTKTKKKEKLKQNDAIIEHDVLRRFTVTGFNGNGFGENEDEDATGELSEP